MESKHKKFKTGDYKKAALPSTVRLFENIFPIISIALRISPRLVSWECLREETRYWIIILIILLNSNPIISAKIQFYSVFKLWGIVFFYIGKVELEYGSV